MVELAKKGCSIFFKDSGKFEVVQGSEVVLSGCLVDGLMELDVTIGGSPVSSHRSSTSLADGNLLHSRLGHPGPVPFSNIHPGIKPPHFCEPCVLAKHHRLPYQGTFKVASNRLELLHSDLSGIISPPSLNGGRYFFEITDSATAYKFVYILHNKHGTLSTFMQFKQYIKNQTTSKIKAIVNENGGEYVSKAFKNYISESGIHMHLTAPYTPQQNPVAEVGNQTTVEKARAMLKHAGLPNTFWAEAVNTAVYLENRTPVVSQGFLTPHELWFGEAPRHDHLRVFGGLAYFHIGKERRPSKFSDTAKRGVMLGYQEGHRNYRIWLLDDHRVFYSHDVVFNESNFPFRETKSKTSSLDEVYFLEDDSSYVELTSPEDSSITVDEVLSAPSPSSVTPDQIVPEGIVEGGWEILPLMISLKYHRIVFNILKRPVVLSRNVH